MVLPEEEEEETLLPSYTVRHPSLLHKPLIRFNHRHSSSALVCLAFVEFEEADFGSLQGKALTAGDDAVGSSLKSNPVGMVAGMETNVEFGPPLLTGITTDCDLVFVDG